MLQSNISKQIKFFLNINYDYKFLSAPKNLLSNFSSARKIYNLFSDENNYFLAARVGYGKTTNAIHLANKLKSKCCILLPLRANVIEFEEYCHQNNIPVGVIRSLGESATRKQRIQRDSEIKSMILSDDTFVYLSVYDNLHHFCQNPNFNSKQFNLIVDEAHNVVTSYKYRTRAIEGIIKLLPKFRKYIFLSGTPEGTIDDALNFKKYLFLPRRKIDSYKKAAVSIVKYKDGGIKKMLHHIVSKKTNGKVVILINNRKLVKKFALTLQKYLPESSEGHGVYKLSSDYKHGDLFLEIAKSKRIPDYVKYLVTTSVIAEGMNILNEDIDSLYMLDVDDWWLKRQFIGRFRLGANNIYDFLSYKYEYAQKWFLPSKARKELVECAEKIAEAKNTINKMGFGSILPSESDQIIKLDKENNLEKWSNGKFKVNKLMVFINIVEKLNRVMALDPYRAIEYYKYIAGFNNVNVVNYSDEFKDGLFNPESYQQVNSIADDELVNNFFSMLNTHIYLTEPSLYASKTFDRDIISNSEEPNSFKAQYYQLLKSGNFMENLLNYLMKLSSKGYPTGYLKYLYNLKLDKPNIDLKKETIAFKNMLIRDLKIMDDREGNPIYRSQLFPKLNIIWELNEYLKNVDYIETETLNEEFVNICRKYGKQNWKLDEAYEVINSLYVSGKIQNRKGNKNRVTGEKGEDYYVKPIGAPKTFDNLYSFTKMDNFLYQMMLKELFLRCLNNPSFQTKGHSKLLDIKEKQNLQFLTSINELDY